MSPPTPTAQPPRGLPLLRRIPVLLRLGILLASGSYVLALVLWIAALRGLGEHHWLTGLALFLPPQGWLLPLAVLVPLQLVLRPPLLLLSLGCLGLVLGFHMRPQAREAKLRIPGTEHLVLVSNNVGQSSLATLQPFLEAHRPDLLLLQECPAMDPGMVQAWVPTAHVARVGEFGVVSRHPIRAHGWVPGLGQAPGESASAAWFEVALPGQTIVVYNVHFPTPRPLLESLTQRHPLRSLRGLAYRFTRSGRREAAAWFDRRVELHRRLREHLASERRPFVVAGDFNLSSHGPEYRAFARAWTDTFAERGSGYGYTVPGITRNPLALRRPWLRIDYIFSGPGWDPLSFAVEPPVLAQHLGLAVVFARPRANT
ncbi:MAG: endonuclease/exonuclease/phosphatase family protein, partial [Verrucomicrobiota bacterium]